MPGSRCLPWGPAGAPPGAAQCTHVRESPSATSLRTKPASMPTPRMCGHMPHSETCLSAMVALLRQHDSADCCESQSCAEGAVEELQSWNLLHLLQGHAVVLLPHLKLRSQSNGIGIQERHNACGVDAPTTQRQRSDPRALCTFKGGYCLGWRGSDRSQIASSPSIPAEARRWGDSGLNCSPFTCTRKPASFFCLSIPTYIIRVISTRPPLAEPGASWAVHSMI